MYWRKLASTQTAVRPRVARTSTAIVEMVAARRSHLANAAVQTLAAGRQSLVGLSRQAALVMQSVGRLTGTRLSIQRGIAAGTARKSLFGRIRRNKPAVAVTLTRQSSYRVDVERR